jgi:hypothetical protein
MWWSASEGTFIDMYGVDAIYQAPDYVVGPDVRDVTFYANAADYNRGNDHYGFANAAATGPATASKPGKVWQVTLTPQQQGNTSQNYDGTPVPAWTGGTTLGWICHGTPAGCVTYGANTQIIGTVGVGPGIPQTGFQWFQDLKGISRHKEGGAWIMPPDLFQGPGWGADWGPGYTFLDSDTRHPNGQGGTDVHEIFAMDAPGFVAGATNNVNIPPDTELEYHMQFKPYVELGGVRVSNEPVYKSDFTVTVVGGVWTAVPGHTP